jgi:hypothetical protein
MHNGISTVGLRFMRMMISKRVEEARANYRSYEHDSKKLLRLMYIEDLTSQLIDAIEAVSESGVHLNGQTKNT